MERRKVFSVCRHELTDDAADNSVRQCIPDLSDGSNWTSSAADSWQFERRKNKMTGVGSI